MTSTHKIDLLLINAPADLGKKAYDLAFSFQRRLNFGLLSLATSAKEKGYEVRYFDPQVDPSRDWEAWLYKELIETNPRIVGISCISGFSYPTALAFAEICRQTVPAVPIVVGGKDHVGQLADTVLKECPAIDVVVKGEAEDVLPILVEALLNKGPLGEIPNIVFRGQDGFIRSTRYDAGVAQPTWQRLDYSLLPDSTSFPPSLEISRGCSFGCEFCVSARTRIRRVTPARIADEAAHLVSHWGDDELKIYFEAPMFIMTDRELRELAMERQRRGLKFTWRAETRVDYLSPERIELLYKAGLRVIDLGLESGDPEALLRMGKTSRPSQYLTNARDILKACREFGITAKINLLFYIGDTLETIRQSFSFLESCNPWVDCVSAYPLLLYPGAKLEGSVTHELNAHGGSLIDDPEWRRRHLTPVNLSTSLPYKRAAGLGLSFGKAFQTMEAFYRQKSYGYFSPRTSFDCFVRAATEYGLEKLPFAPDYEMALAAREGLHDQLFSLKVA